MARVASPSPGRFSGLQGRGGSSRSRRKLDEAIAENLEQLGFGENQ